MKRFNFLKRIIVLTMLLGGIGTPIVEQAQPAQAATAKTNKTRKVKKTKQVKKSKKTAKKTKKTTKKVKIKVDTSKKKKNRPVSFVKKAPETQIPTARVYINLPEGSSDYQITQQAMDAWNDTKAINFKQVTDYRKANIIVNAGNYGNTRWAGITQIPAVPRGYLYGSIISLNNFFLDQVNSEIALSVAEHELGHAIGLEHNDSQPSVMNSAVTDQRAYTIQQCDIDAVKAIYNEK
ncbi:M57 family metalloprotease [Lactobacillus kitasatonis]|uniref:M57 family metalloprotease n=1 Tax=Lactobacillus kitasatonis TaxID=237446 RepID=UPI003F66890B